MTHRSGSRVHPAGTPWPRLRLRAPRLRRRSPSEAATTATPRRPSRATASGHVATHPGRGAYPAGRRLQVSEARPSPVALFATCATGRVARHSGVVRDRSGDLLSRGCGHADIAGAAVTRSPAFRNWRSLARDHESPPVRHLRNWSRRRPPRAASARSGALLSRDCESRAYYEVGVVADPRVCAIGTPGGRRVEPCRRRSRWARTSAPAERAFLGEERRAGLQPAGASARRSSGGPGPRQPATHRQPILQPAACPSLAARRSDEVSARVS
jgi:hypothetical protein